MRHLFVTFAVGMLSACGMPASEQSSAMPALNEAAQSKRFSTFQNALEASPSDRSADWQLSSNVFGSVTPIDTVYSKADGWCRSYEEVIVDGSKRYRIVGIACRDAPRRWLVLDVRPVGGGAE